MMGTLLKTEGKILKNQLFRGSRKHTIGYFISVIVILLFILWVSFSIWKIAPTLEQQTILGLCSYIFLMLLALLVLFGIPQVLQTVFSDRSLMILFSMPIPDRHIFWVKYILNLLGMPFIFLIFTLPPAFVWGIRLNVHFLYYPVVFISILLFILIGTIFAYLLNLIVIQIIPVYRANELMIAIGSLGGIIVYLLITLPSQFQKQMSGEEVLFHLPMLPNWFPTNWASEAIVYSMEGSIQFMPPLLFLILLTLGMIGLLLYLVENKFRMNYIQFQSRSQQRLRPKKRITKDRKDIPSPIIAIGKKEWLSMKRDFREWMIYLPAFVFLIFFGVSFIGSEMSLDQFRSYPEVTWMVVQGILILMVILSNGFSSAATVGREANYLWIMRLIPTRGLTIVLGKLWISWIIPFLIVGVVQSLGAIIFKWSILQFSFGIVFQLCLTIGVSGIGLWVGTIGAKFDPKNPHNRLTFWASMLLYGIAIIYTSLILLPVIYVAIPTEFITVDFSSIHTFQGNVFQTFFYRGILTLLKWKLENPVLMNSIGLITLVVIGFGITLFFIRLTAQRFDRGIQILTIGNQ